MRRVRECESARESRDLGDDAPRASRRIDRAEASFAGFEDPELSVVEARRVGHREAAGDDLVRDDVDDDAAVGFVGAPAFFHVRFAEGRHVADDAVDDGDAVEMAAILGNDFGDEGGRQVSRKLWTGSIAARQEKRVFTMTSSLAAYASSWMRMSPVP